MRALPISSVGRTRCGRRESVRKRRELRRTQSRVHGYAAPGETVSSQYYCCPSNDLPLSRRAFQRSGWLGRTRLFPRNCRSLDHKPEHHRKLGSSPREHRNLLIKSDTSTTHQQRHYTMRRVSHSANDKEHTKHLRHKARSNDEVAEGEQPEPPEDFLSQDTPNVEVQEEHTEGLAFCATQCGDDRHTLQEESRRHVVEHYDKRHGRGDQHEKRQQRRV